MCNKGWLAANAVRASYETGALATAVASPGNYEPYGNLAKLTL